MLFIGISAIFGAFLLQSFAYTKDTCSSSVCSHAGFGYSSWGQVKAETKPSWPGICQTGQIQSPININITTTQTGNEKQLSFQDYDTYFKDYNLANNGHAAQVTLYPNDSSHIGINLEGNFYNLLQFHFYWPSEHEINNKRFPLEMHLVHQNHNLSQLAVIAVLHEFEGGPMSGMLTKFSKLVLKESCPLIEPSEKSMTTDVLQMSSFLEIPTLNPDYYRYEGSLTTPPCTEGVHWVVLKKKAVITPEFYKYFEKLQHCPEGFSPRPMRGNYRPIQKLNGRTVTLYEN